MAKVKALQKTDLFIEGRFLGFATGKSSPFKYLLIESPSGVQTEIKLSKSLRLMLFRYLVPGDLIRVIGKQKIDKLTGEPRLKAHEVLKVEAIQPRTVALADAPSSLAQSQGKAATAPAKAAAKQSQAKGRKKSRVLVCKKSSCRKRGADAVCQSLAMALDQAGLNSQVEIKLTGCMDRCKAGPNIVVMPDKTKYTRVSPNQIPTIIEQHWKHESIEVGNR